MSTHDSSNDHVEAALVAILQWDTYMRPSETLQLTETNILRPAPRAGANYAGRWGLVLGDSTQGRRTKTGLTDAGVSVGFADRAWVRDVLANLVKRATKGGRLFRIGLPAYQAAFRHASKSLRLQHLSPCPHMVRHTGPSEDRMAGLASLAEIQQRGFWTCHQSVARYEKHTKLLRQLQRMTPEQQSEGRRALCALPRLRREAF